MTENSAQIIIDSINNIDKKIDSLEDKMNDRFILLEAKFISRLEKEIGNLAEATAKGFAAQDQKFEYLEEKLRNEMNIGFSMVDHKISSLQEFYASKGVFRLV